MNHRRTVGWILGALVAFEIVAAMLRFVATAARADAFAYPLDYGEGPVLDQAVRLGHLENIYPPSLDTPPFVVANYPPLFPLLVGLVVRAVGPSYLPGRLLAQLSIVAACVLVGLTLERLGRDRVAAAVAALLPLSIPFVAGWAAFAKADTLALALVWGGLYATVAGEGRLRSIVVAGSLFVAATMSKQTYVFAAPATAVTWLWLQSRRRASVTLAGIVLGGVLACFTALSLATAGGFFRHVVSSNVNALSLSTLRALATPVVQSEWLVSAAWVSALAMGLRSLRDRSPLWTFVGANALFTLAPALAAAKTGASVNYFLEALLAGALSIGAWLVLARERLFAASLLATAVAVQCAIVPAGDAALARSLHPVAFEARWAALRGLLERTPGPVIAEEAMGVLPLLGRRIELQPFEMTQLAVGGRWDERNLLARIERREYSLILLNVDRNQQLTIGRWTPAMVASMQRNYAPGRTLDLGGGDLLLPLLPKR